jgi:hypothetical protein
VSSIFTIWRRRSRAHLRLCARRKPVVLRARLFLVYGWMYVSLRMRTIRSEVRKVSAANADGITCGFDSTRLEMNRSIAKQKEIQFVFPSKWLCDLAVTSVRFGRQAEVIPNGFAGEAYRFRDKWKARSELGLQEEQKIIIVAAHFLSEPRKGVSFALSALRAIADLNPLVIFGGNPIARSRRSYCRLCASGKQDSS